MSMAQHVKIATAILSGTKPPVIAQQIGLSTEELTTILKSKSYLLIQEKLANQLLSQAGLRLQSLGNECVSRLERIVKANLKNVRLVEGRATKKLDANLLREVRLACATVLELGDRFRSKPNPKLSKMIDKMILRQVKTMDSETDLTPDEHRALSAEEQEQMKNLLDSVELED